MPKIIKDFIATGRSDRGIGFFEDDEVAIKIARTISKNQIRQFQRHGMIPNGFYRYLKEKGIVIDSIDTSARAIGRSVDDLLEFLWNCPHRDQKSRDAADFLRKLILGSTYPELKSSFATQSSVWARLENSKRQARSRAEK